MAKHSKLTYTLLAIALCSLTTACEKPLLEDEEEYKETEAPKGDMVRITFRNFKTNQKSFSQTQDNSSEREALQSRASEATPITELCKRINFALFDYETGEKNQDTKPDHRRRIVRQNNHELDQRQICRIGSGSQRRRQRHFVQSRKSNIQKQ